LEFDLRKRAPCSASSQSSSLRRYRGGGSKGRRRADAGRATGGIDLPFKALVWQDADGKVWLSYNDPAWIAQRHGLGAASAGAVEAMEKALGAIAAEVTT
jgi:Domain of unknown function DUF302